MRSSIICINILLFISQAKAQQASSLDDLVLLAFKNNMSIKDAAIDSMKYEQASKYNNYNYLPQVSAGMRNTYNWGLFIDPATNVLSNFSSQVYSFNIQSDWLLFDGGKNYYTGQMYDIGKQVSHQQYRQNLFDLKNQLIILYYKYWQTDAQVLQANKVAEQWQHKEKEIKKMINGGILAAKELPHIESYVELYKLNIAKMKNQQNLYYKQIQGICYTADSINIKAPEKSILLSFKKIIFQQVIFRYIILIKIWHRWKPRELIYISRHVTLRRELWLAGLHVAQAWCRWS